MIEKTIQYSLRCDRCGDMLSSDSDFVFETRKGLEDAAIYEGWSLQGGKHICAECVEEIAESSNSQLKCEFCKSTPRWIVTDSKYCDSMLVCDKHKKTAAARCYGEPEYTKLTDEDLGI